MGVKELRKLDKELGKISSKISFYAVNPTNVESERRIFLRKKRYNPQFEYKPYTTNLDSIKEQLLALRTDNTIMGKLFSEAIETYLLDVEMLRARGTAEFTQNGIKIWKRPGKKLVNTAKEILKSVKAKKRTDGKKVVNSREICKALKIALFKYGLRDWKIREKDMVARAAVKVSDKELLIKKNERFSKKFLERLIVHEIGTHVIRAENGEKQPYKIFKRGLPNYLMTEEGLAVVNEELNGCLDPFTLKVYAGRVLAIDKALKGSFRSTYNYLRKHFTKDVAWRLTVRAKRGIGDTSKAGGCTKDIAYLKGYLAIKKYVEKGGNIDDLYYGKIGLQHVEDVKRIRAIVSPMYLPTIRYFLFFIETVYEQLRNILFLDLPYFDRYPLKLVRDVHPLNFLKDKFGMKFLK